jgi:hypothetical protein
MDKVSRAESRACGRDPPFLFFFKLVTCGLWPPPVDHGACLRAGPSLFFYLSLRAGGILPALLFLVRNFLHLRM